MRKGKQVGFTLIEVLVIIALIGILAAIAMPKLAAYRARGFDARAENDCRNAATAEEAYFIDHAGYSPEAGSLPGFVQSQDVDLALTGDAREFTVTCSSPKGTPGFSCVWSHAAAVGESNLVCTTT